MSQEESLGFYVVDPPYHHRVYDMVDWAAFLRDGSVREGDYGCTSQHCAMYASILDYGILMAGSSGSGMIHQGRRGVGAIVV